MHAKITAIKFSSMIGFTVLILAIFLPDYSTLIVGVVAGSDHLMACIVIGVLQILTCLFLVGWLWASYDGFKIFSKIKAVVSYLYYYS